MCMCVRERECMLLVLLWSALCSPIVQKMGALEMPFIIIM